MQLFRYREDRPYALFFALILACDIAVYLSVDSPYFLAAYTLLGVLPKSSACAFNHHHQHVPMFLRPLGNRIIEFIFGLLTGITANAWVLHHSLGHHVNYLDQEKDESRWQRKDGSTMGELEYSLNVAITAYPRAWEVSKRYKTHRPVFVSMALLNFGFIAAALAWRPLPALFVWVIPGLISLVGTAWATYDHHSELPTDNDFVACRNILNPVYNIVTGNLGYHTAHHHRAGIHWSRLPEHHASIADKIPAACYTKPGLPWVWFENPEPTVTAPEPSTTSAPMPAPALAKIESEEAPAVVPFTARAAEQSVPAA